MKQYRKKPVVIQAVQVVASTFDGEYPNPDHVPGVVYDPVARVVLIETLEGVMTGNIGDWIIRGVEGELYPCKDNIFQKTYEPVDPVDPKEWPLTLTIKEGGGVTIKKTDHDNFPSEPE